MNGFVERFGFLAPDWKDLVEILLVAAVLYRVLLVLAGTRAIQMLVGAFVIVAIYAGARVLDLSLVEYLLETVFQFGVIAALVVFQPELRSALAQLGQNRLLRFFSRLEQTQVAEEVVQAVEEMSRGKIGAIIAIEREIGLGEYLESGTPLQARVSDALLLNIFTPYSLLHDGAAIIRGDDIVAAGVILPLTQQPVADRSLGTRHRAALGLSEETDALVVVVSEETGAITLAHGGRLFRNLDPDELKEMLIDGPPPLSATSLIHPTYLHDRKPSPSGRRPRIVVTHPAKGGVVDASTAVERALPVFAATSPNDWRALRAGLAREGVPTALANDVASFMPIAFGRELLDGSGMEFSPDYATGAAGGGLTIAGKLAEHPVYAAAAALATRMVERREGGDSFVAVAVWSAEFSAANQALHAGADLANLVAGPPVIMHGDDAPEPPASSASADPAPEKKRPWWRVWG